MLGIIAESGMRTFSESPTDFRVVLAHFTCMKLQLRVEFVTPDKMCQLLKSIYGIVLTLLSTHIYHLVFFLVMPKRASVHLQYSLR